MIQFNYDMDAYTRDMATFLSCLLLDVSILDLTRIKPSMMLRRDGQIVLEVIQKLNDSKVVPDHLTLFDELLNRGKDFETTRMWAAQNVNPSEVASASNWEYYESRLVDAWAQKKINDACNAVSESVGPSISAMDKVAMLEKAISEISLIETGWSIVTIREAIPKIVKEIEDRYNRKGELIGVPTGIPALDSATYGMQEGAFWVIGARPSKGKSALMGQIHRNVALRADTRCGVISIESSITEIGLRSISAEGRIDGSKISMGLLDYADFADVQSAAEKLYELDDKISYYDKPSMTLTEVRQIARRMVRKHNIKILFIDYLQLIEINESALTIFQVVAKVSKGLKALARELKICICALAQAGRKSDDDRPGLGDFQYSSQIEQDADVALLLWHYKDEAEKQKSFIIVGKARDGIVTDIPVKFDKSIMTFFEVDPNAQG